MAGGADQGNVEQAGGEAHVGVGQGHDTVLAHVAGVLKVAAGGHSCVHVGDGAAVHRVPAGADDGVQIAAVQAGVRQGQPGRLEVMLVALAVGGGGGGGRLADAAHGASGGQ